MVLQASAAAFHAEKSEAAAHLQYMLDHDCIHLSGHDPVSFAALIFSSGNRKQCAAHIDLFWRDMFCAVYHKEMLEERAPDEYQHPIPLQYIQTVGAMEAGIISQIIAKENAITIGKAKRRETKEERCTFMSNYRAMIAELDQLFVEFEMATGTVYTSRIHNPLVITPPVVYWYTPVVQGGTVADEIGSSSASTGCQVGGDTADATEDSAEEHDAFSEYGFCGAEYDHDSDTDTGPCESPF
jgi:hypothetical protein